MQHETPVGKPPSDWQFSTVGSSFEICNSERKPINRSQRQMSRGPYPYYGPTGILDYIDEYRYEGEFALIAEDGDSFLKFSTQPMTLMVRGRFNVNNHAHVIADLDGNSARWFQRFFEHRDVTRSLTRQGVARYKLTKAALRELQLAIPSPLEQDAIVAVLDDADALIVALEQQIAKKRAIRHGTMQALLTGRVRLLGFSTPWTRRLVGDLLAPRSERNVSGEPLEVLSCTKHEGFVRSLDFFKNQVFSRDLTGYRVILRGDIGYPANHVEEGSIGVQELFERALVSPIYVVLHGLGGNDTFFLHRQMKLESFRQQCARATSSSVDRRGSLRWGEFSQIALDLPAPDEQRAIAAVLRDADAEIEVLDRRLEGARAIKRGMMQELLVGRIRLVGGGTA